MTRAPRSAIWVKEAPNLVWVSLQACVDQSIVLAEVDSILLEILSQFVLDTAFEPSEGLWCLSLKVLLEVFHQLSILQFDSAVDDKAGNDL